MLGNARLEAVCSDGVTRICHIRGSLRNKVSVEVYFPLVQSLPLKHLSVLQVTEFGEFLKTSRIVIYMAI